MDRLTQAEFEVMRYEHTDRGGVCYTCCTNDERMLIPTLVSVPFPCDAARLLAELDERDKAVRSWQGRNHQSPVPHLAEGV